MSDRPAAGEPSDSAAQHVADRDGPVTVTLDRPDDRETTLDVRPGETVVEAAERVDDGIPFGCLTGACGTCTGRLVAADVSGSTGDQSASDAPPAVREVFSYRRPPRALKERHERDGYVLLCVAEPTVPCRLEVGAAIQAELVENPWRSSSSDA